MRFKLAQLEAIKSASQRALAAYWDRLATGRRFPAFTDLKPDPEMYDPKQLVVWDVEGEGAQPEIQGALPGRQCRGGVQQRLGRQDDGAGRSDVAAAIDAR
jgi:hypothetical protein